MLCTGYISSFKRDERKPQLRIHYQWNLHVCVESQATRLQHQLMGTQQASTKREVGRALTQWRGASAGGMGGHAHQTSSRDREAGMPAGRSSSPTPNTSRTSSKYPPSPAATLTLYRPRNQPYTCRALAPGLETFSQPQACSRPLSPKGPLEPSHHRHLTGILRPVRRTRLHRGSQKCRSATRLHV